MRGSAVEASFAATGSSELGCGPLRGGRNVELDLHWRLSTLPVFAFRFDFAELMAASQPLPGLHPHARGLGPAHALLHACMHRVQNMPDGSHDDSKWLRDIELLIAALEQADGDGTTLAIERMLAAVCHASLVAAGAPVPPVRNARAAAAAQGRSARSTLVVRAMCHVRAIPAWASDSDGATGICPRSSTSTPAWRGPNSKMASRRAMVSGLGRSRRGRSMRNIRRQASRKRSRMPRYVDG